MIPNLNIFFPGKFVFANGSFLTLLDECKNLQLKRVFIISVLPLQKNIEEVCSLLKTNNIDFDINYSIEKEPDFKDFDNVLQQAKQFNPDTVIGIGGGSVLDVAKLVAAQIDNNQSLQEIVGIGLLNQRSRKLICLPTTSGTGSEVSPNAILIDNTDGQKKGIISKFLVPDIVIIDPILTINLPPQITAATGIDALTHCLEAYTNKFAKPFLDIWALQGVKLIAENITEAVHNPINIYAKEQLALGSVLGGFCLGPVNTAGVHALSYPLGSLYHLPHGLSNALLLPYVMEYNLHSNIEKHAQLAIAFGCKPTDDKMQLAQNGVSKIKEIIKAINLPLHLNEVGVIETDIEQMAIDAMKIQRLLKNNPREITVDNAIEIYKAAL